MPKNPVKCLCKNYGRITLQYKLYYNQAREHCGTTTPARYNTQLLCVSLIAQENIANLISEQRGEITRKSYNI